MKVRLGWDIPWDVPKRTNESDFRLTVFLGNADLPKSSPKIFRSPCLFLTSICFDPQTPRSTVRKRHECPPHIEEIFSQRELGPTNPLSA